MNDDADLLDRIDFWVKKICDGLDEQVELAVKADPNADAYKIRELYLVNKIATLTVAIRDMTKHVRELEQKIKE